MTRLVSFLALNVLLSTVAVSAEGAVLSDNELRFVAALPPLRVMVDDDFGPLSRWNPETARYEGVAVELFQTVADRMGLRYEFFHDPGLTWNQKVDFFFAGQADVLLPLSQTPERAAKGRFSSSFFETTYAAVALVDLHRRLDQAEDLSAWRVGVVRNTAIVPFLKTVVPASQLVLFENARELYRALREGSVDFVLQNALVFQEDRYTQELFDLVAVRNITEWPRRYAFYFPDKPEFAQLVPLVDRVLSTIDIRPLIARYETGIEGLILRYTDQRHRQDLLLLFLGTALMGLLLLSVLLWNQRRLKASEARFRALAEASFGGIALHEAGVILESNKTLSDMMGYGRHELIGMNGLLLIAPEHRDQVWQHIRSGYTPTYEVTGMRKDGTRLPLGIRGKNIPYQGRPVRVTEFFDLTGQKDAESATLREKQRYDTLVAKIPVGVYVVRAKPDGTAGFDFVSPRMAEMLEVGVEETLADMNLAFRAIHPEDRPGMEALNARAIAGQEPFDWKGRAVTQGQVRWFHVSSVPEAQDNGDILWHGLVVDITDQKRADEKIRSLLEEKDLILREVHHRIKNNMGTVTGLLTLQASTLTDPAAVQALEDAKGRVLSMMVLYDKLYLSSGLNALSLAEYLPSLVTQVIENFPNAASVQVETRAEDVVVDTKTLSSVGIIVNELLTNIMKYAFLGRTGGLIAVTADRSGGLIRLTVEDNGRGLPEGFDPSQSRGFGLSLIDLLTKHLGGSLTLERGAGTRVILQFPEK